MTTGIPYFGGKSKIGKYLYNTIFNMAVTMYDNGNKPLIFVDAFTSGGKMALSMPDGWFKLIVMNDLDYGVYCYYKCCQENYRLLLSTVDKLVSSMSEQMFHKCLEIREDRTLEPYMCGAMTYVCAACSFNNILEPSKASYKPAMGDNNERQELDKVKVRAHKAITKVAKQLNRRDYIIENLSYEQFYFVKSDYNPKVTVANAKNKLEMIGNNKKEDMSDSERKIYDQCIGILVHEEEMMYDFDRIEDERKGFQCFCVGGFDKGAIAKEDEKLVKTVGYEYVWCKGLPAGYTDIPKVTDKV